MVESSTLQRAKDKLEWMITWSDYNEPKAAILRIFDKKGRTRSRVKLDEDDMIFLRDRFNKHLQG